MITAWDVYWVMQLDSIKGSVEFLAFFGLVVALGLTIWNGVSRLDTNEYPGLCDPKAREAAWAHRAAVRKVVLCVSLPAILLGAVIPSTKTAAAMIVLPALTSEEVTKPLAKEAGDLYRLAKRALEEAVDAEPEK